LSKRLANNYSGKIYNFAIYPGTLTAQQVRGLHWKMFNELNNLIQNQVVYSIYKLGMAKDAMGEDFQAPNLLQRARNFSGAAKTMGEKAGASESIHAKIKDGSGNKVGRNDPCPCGAAKPDGTPIKYKHCCGR